ncbi:MAG: orotidine-5'-phosphate decarboxylase [Oscillospiraceae bacterium]|jgi:orotidine-5'-phosphate decarboxylase|nr:orotidine-5'-phosphate decarboxylase [Oscillospiraceae bacterium]
MSFTGLRKLISAKDAPICVGLDPSLTAHPDVGKLLEFNKRIIDAVAEFVPCVKPQAAFYEARGLKGLEVLRDTIRYARERGLYVLLDAKRGDIGSTAEAYANAYLQAGAEFECDAITVNAYTGSDGVKPFLESAVKYDKAIFALVKTSNPSSGELQDVPTSDGESVYVKMAKLLDGLGDTDHLGYVVGATYSDQLAELRTMFPQTFFLVPGYGAQGGSAASVKPAFDGRGGGAIVNNSRGIIESSDPQAAVVAMAAALREVRA